MYEIFEILCIFQSYLNATENLRIYIFSNIHIILGHRSVVWHIRVFYLRCGLVVEICDPLLKRPSLSLSLSFFYKF